MATITDDDQFDLCLTLARADAELRRQFDAELAAHHGLSLNDTMILLAIHRAPDQQLRRVDLAARLGLTASGVTRLLGPLERVGLIERVANPADARVALTILTKGGQQRVEEALDSARRVAHRVLGPRFTADEVALLTDLLARLLPGA